MIKLKYLLILPVLGLLAAACSDTDDASQPEAPYGNYTHIIFYGQSLSIGQEAPLALTKETVYGNYMFGNCPIMQYSVGASMMKPLAATVWSKGGEQPIVSTVNILSDLHRKEIDRNAFFLATSGGNGGQSIEKISRGCTNGTGDYFNKTFIKALNQAKAVIDKGYTIQCPAIVFMQGEYNYAPGSKGQGMTSGTDATTDKDEYKALLLQLKNDMQQEVMAAYEQPEKPLFFLYQVSGRYINELTMPVNMAQLEFAAENQDVVLLNPCYFAPNYTSGHLSSNGYRWYGEMVAKALYRKLIKQTDSAPVRPVSYAVDGNRLTIGFNVPYLPLEFDTRLVEQAPDFGFEVHSNGVRVALSGCAVEGSSVILTASEALTGTIEVAYAGKNAAGTGNLRDSDPWQSTYTYADDSSDPNILYRPTGTNGNPIFGSHYPMYNWCVPFYHKLSE